MVKSNREKGQIVPLLVVALSLVLVGAMGLAIDGAHLWDQLQRAQLAADSAATAGALTIFQGTNTASNPGHFPTPLAPGSFNCTTNDAEIPCVYARMNGFGGTAADTVKVDFPTCTGSPDPCGYETALAGNLPPGTPNQIRVSITRNVDNFIIRMLGAALNTPVATSATAAIIAVQTPTPIIVTDPYDADSLHMNGNTGITICGGPIQSIQVNSCANSNGGKPPCATKNDAFSPPSSGSVDLSKAGPADSGACDTGTGASFGIFGGPAGSGSGTVNHVNMGTTGKYIEPHSPIADPFANVAAPNATTLGLTVRQTSAAKPATPVSIATGVDNCVAGPCLEYSPGIYRGGFSPSTSKPVIFKPGVYFIEGGDINFKQVSGGGTNNALVCTSCAADPTGSTGTGILIFLTGPSNDAGEAGVGAGVHNGGIFNFGPQAAVLVQGPTQTKTVTDSTGTHTVPDLPYYGITFWYDRLATNFTNIHTFGQGTGCFGVIGTTYITPTLAIMQNPLYIGSKYQVAAYNGTPCGNTLVKGDIIVSDLSVVGTSSVTMNLQPFGFLYINQVALVDGGAHP